jgi:hypothetical protein
MRKNIYQQSRFDMVGEEVQLDEYVMRMEIGDPSYDVQGRTEIMLQ